MDLGIEGRVAIVTGGSRGIGRETAREFLEAGVKVMTCARNGDAVAATCEELAKQTGGDIRSIKAHLLSYYITKYTKPHKKKYYSHNNLCFREIDANSQYTLGLKEIDYDSQNGV